ncbi:MAG: pyridoxal phosphate-dependent transferase [Piptocephalis tieghemiana]|nr:MAG: pyridoxal phosphate-dependent transferase [Piptocephalis tieghemiana]
MPSDYQGKLEKIRQEEYPQLEKDTYLDYAGAPPFPKSLVREYAEFLTSGSLQGNPHSGNAQAQRVRDRVAEARTLVLDHLNADPSHYTCIFTSGATAALKLVGESFPWQSQNSTFWYLQDNHTSVLGIREMARSKGADVQCVSREKVTQNLCRSPKGSMKEGRGGHGPCLLAYPAQSNYNGQRYPLSWGTEKPKHWRVLLDAAAYVSTSSLSLTRHPVDFCVLSFYKMFGFPTGLGALIVRQDALKELQRPYFGGGAVDAILATEPFHRLKQERLHEGFEDGTIHFHAILSLHLAFATFHRLYGSFDHIAHHTQQLTLDMHRGLSGLKHENGVPLVKFLTPVQDPPSNHPSNHGPIITFHLVRPSGQYVGYAEVAKVAALEGISLRTGSFCNPGASQVWLGLTDQELREQFEAGHVCGDEKDMINGRPTGAVRASLGASSSIRDVDHLIHVLSRYFLNPKPITARMNPLPVSVIQDAPSLSEGWIGKLIIYPIKSCGGYSIPLGTAWMMGESGLEWDREWMLTSVDTGRALDQKKYPKMCLIRPRLDFTSQSMLISAPDMPDLAIPLNEEGLSHDESSRVHETPGNPSPQNQDGVSTRAYNNVTYQAWFTSFLGIPCKLVRCSKEGRRKDEESFRACKISSGLTDKAMKEDQPKGEGTFRLSLANKSPYLLINQSSVQSILNVCSLTPDDHAGVGMEDGSCFRANLVLEGFPAWEEDEWESISLGDPGIEVKLLGKCQRCHMVCVDQRTAEKRKEPYAALALYRKFQGKLYFGQHARISPKEKGGLIQVGSPVRILQSHSKGDGSCGMV